ncbi:hypothetical protein DUNSADRAFT_17936 [Dunaliella salina]|uniref:Uncharacterized protein n=1 Tax=Dunaliella salina TaxID=3046 RepID=A0ABQ7H929_DUNSA|nr:hypothetical protein DUNSADRAFT_17936 [Dunaliella salina]|eukprot:KAF5843358.1 hypothetical protein DUNSADRAFT_17936 [Dunaliella salina]
MCSFLNNGAAEHGQAAKDKKVQEKLRGLTRSKNTSGPSRTPQLDKMFQVSTWLYNLLYITIVVTFG